MTASEGHQLVQRWRESGLSMRAFAEAEGVAAHCLWYWKKRLGANDSTSSSADFVVLTPTDVEVDGILGADGDDSVEDAAADGAVEIVLENGELVRIPRGTATLTEIFHAVRRSHQ